MRVMHDLGFQVLSILSSEGDPTQRYGYAIWQQVVSMPGAEKVKVQQIYPVLGRLAKKGYAIVEGIETSKDYKRKRRETWSLTAAGREHLEAERAQWRALKKRLDQWFDDGR